jgi:hypothetical protein
VILKSGAVQNELNFTSSQRLSRPVSVARIWETLQNYLTYEIHFLSSMSAYCPEHSVSNDWLAKERIQSLDAKMKIIVCCLPGWNQKILSKYIYIYIYIYTVKAI